MILKEIKIINFGQLSDLTFDLPSSHLNIFFGANEAGKSTTVAFIKQIMFGFYLRNNSSPFFEDYKPLAQVSPMGGALYFEDEKTGDRYKLERLWAKGDKTKRGILTVKKDGEEVPPNVFFDKIHNIDDDFYTDSFIFNQEMLGKITALKQEDLLERIYYLGAANSTQLIEERDKFAKEAGMLFKKTGKKPEVNRLLQELQTKREDLTESQTEFSRYKELQAEFDCQNKKLAEQNNALAELTNQKHHLEKLKKDFVNYQTLQKLNEQKKKISFDNQNYQKTQSLYAQETNLKEIIANEQRHLEKLADNKWENNYDELLQKKPELLQWQAEDRAYRQKADQIKAEEEQILALTPELGQVLDKSHEQIQELQTDFNKLPKKENVVQSSQSIINSTTVIGLLVTVLGIAGVTLLKSSAVIFIIAGLIIGIYGGYSQFNKNKKVKLLADKAKIANQKRINFQNKYGLNPDQLNLKDLLLQLNQYKLKLQAEKENSKLLNELSTNLIHLANGLSKALNRKVQPEFKDLLVALNELETENRIFLQSQNKRHEIQANSENNQQQLKEVTLQIKLLLAQAGVVDIEEYNDLYKESLEQAKIQTQIATLKTNLADSLDELKKLAQSSDNLDEQLKEISVKITQKEKEISTLHQNVAKIQVQLTNLANSTVIFEKKQSLAETEAQFVNASKEYLAALFASKWIARALDLASNERFPKMLKSAKEYFNILTGGRYNDIILDKKLSVVRSDGKKREVKFLSRGTSEQLYFALKLAFIEQIKDQINLPILIDDSFVNFDNSRIEYIVKLLKKVADSNQILIFTAQENLIDKLGIRPLTFERNENA